MLRWLTLRSVQISFVSALISASSSALIDLAVSTAERERAIFVDLTITVECSLPEASRIGGHTGTAKINPKAPSFTAIHSTFSSSLSCNFINRTLPLEERTLAQPFAH